MAQVGQVLGRRDDRRDQGSHRQERILQDETDNITFTLVLGDELDANGSPQALAVDDQLVTSCLGSVPQVVEGSLRIQHQALLIGFACRQAIAAVLQHKHIAANVVDDHAGNWQSVADVACIAVEHYNSTIREPPVSGTPDVEGRELFAIVCGDHQFLEVLDAKLRRSWNFSSGIGGHVRWVDQGPTSLQKEMSVAHVIQIIRIISREDAGGFGMVVSWAAVGVLLLFKVEERREDSGNALCNLY